MKQGVWEDAGTVAASGQPVVSELFKVIEENPERLIIVNETNEEVLAIITKNGGYWESMAPSSSGRLRLFLSRDAAIRTIYREMEKLKSALSRLR